MAETEELTQRINELEGRIDYLEKRFNVNRRSSEILFPKAFNVVDAKIETTNGDQ